MTNLFEETLLNFLQTLFLFSDKNRQHSHSFGQIQEIIALKHTKYTLHSTKPLNRTFVFKKKAVRYFDQRKSKNIFFQESL